MGKIKLKSEYKGSQFALILLCGICRDLREKYLWVITPDPEWRPDVGLRIAGHTNTHMIDGSARGVKLVKLEDPS